MAMKWKIEKIDCDLESLFLILSPLDFQDDYHNQTLPDKQEVEIRQDQLLSIQAAVVAILKYANKHGLGEDSDKTIGISEFLGE